MAKLSVIIPTYNRPGYLKRSIQYWNKSEYSVIIVDGSLLSYKGIIPNNINYYHMPDYNYQYRLSAALNLVKTPYVVFCADDDFHGFNALKKCIEYLDENFDYSSVQGKYLKFKCHNKLIELSLGYENSWNYEVNSDNLSLRMIQAVNPYMHHIYAVHRTDIVKIGFNNLPDINNNRLLELHFAMVSSIFGKHRILPFFYSARERIDSSGGEITQNIPTWLNDGENKQIYFSWRAKVVEIIENFNFYSEDKSKQAFDGCIEAYLNYIKLREKNCKNNKSIKNMIKPYIPQVLFSLGSKLINNNNSNKKNIRQKKSDIFDSSTKIGLQNIQAYSWDKKNTIEDWQRIREVLLHSGY